MWKYIKQVKRDINLENAISSALKSSSTGLYQLVQHDLFEDFLNKLEDDNFIDLELIEKIIIDIAQYNNFDTSSLWSLIDNTGWLSDVANGRRSVESIGINQILAYICIVVENAFDPILALYLYANENKKYAYRLDPNTNTEASILWAFTSEYAPHRVINKIDLPWPWYFDKRGSRKALVDIIMGDDYIDTHFKSIDEILGEKDFIKIIGELPEGIISKMKVGNKYYVVDKLRQLAVDKRHEETLNKLKTIPGIGDFYRLGDAGSYTVCCHRQGYSTDSNKPINVYSKSNQGLLAGDFPVFFQSEKEAEDFAKKFGLSKDSVYKARLTSTDKQNGFVEVTTTCGKCLVQKYKISSLF